MPSSMAFFRELRAPLVALATVALLGALILPPKVQAALATVYCAPQISSFVGDGSHPEAPAPTHCVLCVMVLAMGLQPIVLGEGRHCASVFAPGVQARADVALRQVRNRGPPRTR